MQPAESLTTAKQEKSLLLRIVLFGGIGFLILLVNFAVTLTLREILGVPEEYAYAIGLGTALVLNFIACRQVVFQGKDQGILVQFISFLCSSALFRGAEYLTFLLFVKYIGLDYRLCVFLVAMIWVAIKFVFYDRIMFSPRKARSLEGVAV